MSSSPNYTPLTYKVPVKSVIILSVSFHILLIILVPLFSKFLDKKEIKPKPRPKSFTLVTVPKTVIKPKVTPKKRAVEKKKVTPNKRKKPKTVVKPKVTKKPKAKSKVTKKSKPKKKTKSKKSVQKSTNDLDNLFSDEPIVTTSHKNSGSEPIELHKHQWYDNMVRNKIQNNWNPAIKDSLLTIKISFNITKNGALTDFKIIKSSGKD